MEEATTPAAPISQASAPTPQAVVVHKSNNVPLVGAIIFLALVVAAAAVYLGMQKKPETASTIPPTSTPPTPTTTVETPITLTPSTKMKVLSYTSTKLKDNSASAYTISYPSDWQKDTKRDEISDLLTLTKGEYSIKIYQAPMGGSGCTFKGDAPSEMSQDYSNKEFVEIKTGDTTFRRVKIDVGKPPVPTYTFCASNPSTKGSFGSPTSFGAITYTVPATTDEVTLSQMDSVIASLKAN